MNKTEIKLISIMKFLTASSHFCCFGVFPERRPEKFQMQAKKIPDYFSVSYEYDETFCFMCLYDMEVLPQFLIKLLI